MKGKGRKREELKKINKNSQQQRHSNRSWQEETDILGNNLGINISTMCFTVCTTHYITIHIAIM